MAELTALEQEIIEATGFKMKRFANRQDYLAAIARAMEKMPGDAYDNLSDEASDWYEAAATAVNGNDDIPDFPADDESDAEEDTAADDEVADDDEEDADEADDEADEASEDADDEGEEPEADEEGDEEVEPEPKPAAKKPVKTKGKEPKAAKSNGKEAKEPEDKGPRPEVIQKMRAKKQAAEAKKGKQRDLPKTRYDDLSGVKNRYGYYEGTKVDEACKMFEKGATMAEVKDVLGDVYYNLLRKARADGHSVEKNDAGKFVLRHKDAVGGGKREKAKSKAKE